MRLAIRSRPGLTLVEVVVSTLLLAAGVVCTLSVQAAITKSAARAHQRRLLAVAAANALDSLRALPCAGVSAGGLSGAFGQLTWTTQSGAGPTLTLSLVATPRLAPAWRAETILPCP
jgi:Tfp pilus assembly protein PilV